MHHTRSKSIRDNRPLGNCLIGKKIRSQKISWERDRFILCVFLSSLYEDSVTVDAWYYYSRERFRWKKIKYRYFNYRYYLLLQEKQKSVHERMKVCLNENSASNLQRTKDVGGGELMQQQLLLHSGNMSVPQLQVFRNGGGDPERLQVVALYRGQHGGGPQRQVQDPQGVQGTRTYQSSRSAERKRCG